MWNVENKKTNLKQKRGKSMKKLFQKLTEKIWNKEEGFTLIELIIVIAILAIISAIAVPNVLEAIDNSRKTTDISNAKIIADAAATVMAQDESYADPTDGDYDITNDSTGFAGAVSDKLNNVELAPKYNSDTLNTFVLNVSGSDLHVYASPDSGSSGATELYPSPASAYDLD